MIGNRAEKPPSALTGLLALIPLGVGSTLLVLGLSDLNSLWRLDSRGESTTGTVVYLLKIKARRGDEYCPLVRFTVPGGTVIQFTDRACGDSDKRQIGEQLRVRYLPESPAQSAAVDKGRAAWLMPGFAALLGLLSVSLAMSLIAKVRRARRRY